MFKRLSFVVYLVVVFCSTPLFGQKDAPVNTFTNKKLDSALLHHKQQLESAQLDETYTNLSLKHWQLGNFYLSAGVFSEAIDQFNQALLHLKDKSDTLQVTVKNSIGMAELSLKNFAQAEAYFNEAIQESIMLNYKRGQAISKSFLGSCLEKEGNYKMALKYQNESLVLFESLHDMQGLALVNENLGSIYEDLENYDLAYDYFNTAYSLVKGQGSPKEVNVLNNLGDVNRKKGNYQKALYYTNDALSLAKLLGDGNQLASANKDLSKTYVFLGDFQKAFFHMQEAERINEEGFYAQNTDQFNLLQTVYETNKKEAKIRFLEQENELNKTRRNLLSVLLAGGCLMVIGLYSYLLKRRKAKTQIQEYQKRLLETKLEKQTLIEENLQNEIQLKTAALSKYSLHLSQKNKVLHNLSTTLKNIGDRNNMDIPKKLKVLAKDIDHSLKYEHEWKEFVNYFSDIHPHFLKKLSNYTQEKLSSAELRLAILLRLNLSSKEIASILRVTPDSIRVARHRLRKKLAIAQKEQLVHFLLSL